MSSAWSPWWRRGSNVPASRPTQPAAPRPVYAPPIERVVYISPERAENEARLVAARVEKAISRQLGFCHFVQRGDSPLPKLLKRAFETGSASFEDWANGDAWAGDPTLRSQFEAALRIAGFEATYRVLESDGPEADRYVYTLKPMGGSK
jgi:hypothetical protein